MPSHLLSMGFTYLGCFSKAILAGGLAWSTTRFGKDLLKQKSTNLNVYMRNDLYRLICPSFRTSNCMHIRQCVCLTFKQQKDYIVYNNEVRKVGSRLYTTILHFKKSFNVTTCLLRRLFGSRTGAFNWNMYMKVRIRDTKSKTQSGEQTDGIAKG